MVFVARVALCCTMNNKTSRQNYEWQRRNELLLFSLLLFQGILSWKDEYAEMLIDHNNCLCWVYWNLYKECIDVFIKKCRYVSRIWKWKNDKIYATKIWYCSLQLEIINKTWKAAHTYCRTVHIFFYAFLVDMPYSTLPLSDIPCHLMHITPIYVFLRYLHFLCVDISIFPKIKNVTKNSSPMVIEVKTSFLYVRYKTKGIILS